MTVATTLFTDATTEATVVAAWLTRTTGRAFREVLEPRATEADRKQHSVSLVEGATGADIDGSEVVRLVRQHLEPLDPFARRLGGAAVIDQLIAHGGPDADALMRLVNALAAGRPIIPPARSGRPGRPPGSDPFQGAGFDVCVTLLLHPDRTWTQAALADAAGRSVNGVRRILIELETRGFVERTRGATTLRHPGALRESLLEHWQQRPRSTTGFSAPSPGTALEDLAAVCDSVGLHALAAGPSAAAYLVGGPEVVYAPPEVVEALEARRWRVTRAAASDVVVWSPPESGVWLFPRPGTPLRWSNTVVTWLDLCASGDDRQRDAAQQLWALE